MNSFTIKDLENLSGIKAHTIRIWEQRYSFLKPGRTQTNIRYYSCEELKTILNVALLNKYGFKISHIDKMNDGEISDKIMSLNQQEAQLERVINALIQNMVDLDMDGFENVLDDFITTKGMEKTITQIVFPFLEKIGILWQTNNINPAQEHLVSNIIRQKLLVAIDGIGNHQGEQAKTVLLFLPESEFHELGLLFMNFIFKNNHFKTIYLGASISLEDVKYVVDNKNTDYLFTHITTVGAKFNLERFIDNIANLFPTVPTVISGALTQAYAKPVKPPVSFLHSFAEAMDFVAKA